MRKVYFNEDARSRILAGAERLYNAVKTTMSPKGRNVIIKRSFGGTITHDGVTVAEAMDITDTPETLGWSVGADLIRNAAQKINAEVGDGTTSVTVLTYCLMKEADKLIRMNYNAMEIRAAIEAAVEELIAGVDKMAIKLETPDQLINVATISSGSKELGEIIGKAAASVGKDGSITVEAGKGYDTVADIVDGFVFERGYFSPYFITNRNRMECVIDNPVIIITNKKYTTAEDVAALFERFEGTSKRNFVLICDELSGAGLSLLVSNVVDKRINAVAIKAPEFGENRDDILADIAVLTGGETAPEFEDDMLYECGTAEKVVVSKDKTTIVKGGGDKLEIKKHIEVLTDLIKINEGNKYECEKIKSRIANLASKVAIIRVGGATETEIDEKKYRIDDAVAATKAAMDGGIVGGGGIAYMKIGQDLKQTDGVDEVTRAMIRDVMKQPFLTILANAGVSPDKYIDFIIGEDGKVGIDVINRAPVNLFEAGIIDPAKVIKAVVKAAFSIAASAITADVLIVDVPDKD